jgi:glucose-6-phosphate 1-dehydrogenase
MRTKSSNQGRPFVTDFQPYQTPQPCEFVIFGVTGDLTHRLVIPALYNLAVAELLPDRFCVGGVARRGMSNDALRESLMKGLRRFATRPVEDKIARRLLECVSCIEADPSEPASFDRLKQQLERLEAAHRTGGNRLFYLATPPDAFAPIARQLGRVALLKEQDGAWRRLVVEKPFGTDLPSARALNEELLKILGEHQIFRIDHYLGKETVQNILVLRFANGMFEPIWNRHHIDHVQITVEEKLAVGHRGSTPKRAAIQTQSEDEALKNSVRGQYTAGKIDDTEIPDYRKTLDVRPDSATETYVAMKLNIDNWRWAGVPFYLRTGKALAKKRTELAIKFRQAPFAMFRCTPVEQLAENYLVICIEPTEGITLQFNTKVPGPVIRIDGVQMKFHYKDYFKVEPATGYETLIYDCMIGDNILFQRAEGVEASWQAVQPFLDAWKRAGDRGLEFYPAGSDGPPSAFELLKRDGRSWRNL